MSDTTTEHIEAHEDDHAHPSDWEYVKIALILGAITAVEVFTYFESVLDWGSWLIPSLIFMMVIKFWLVAMWFMHLKSDNNIFQRLFGGGLALAIAVYIIALTSSEFFA